MENSSPLWGAIVGGGEGKVESTSNPIARPFVFRPLHTVSPMGWYLHVPIPVHPKESIPMGIIGIRTTKCKYNTAAM